MSPETDRVVSAPVSASAVARSDETLAVVRGGCSDAPGSVLGAVAGVVAFLVSVPLVVLLMVSV
ncbi:MULTISPECIES: hypothetical protein [unclassified Microbacterium]|uniref:hypothetical protein n=1 Tax=Microbacterium TaxID=33882 RepID=UPI003BA214EF